MTHLLLPESHHLQKVSTSLSSLIKQSEFDYLPSLKNFFLTEIPTLQKRLAFFLNSLKPGDPLFSALKMQISKRSLETLENYYELDLELFLFFIKYVLQLSRYEGNNHKIHVLVIEIDNFRNSAQISFAFFQKLENICDNMVDLDDVEVLIYLLKIEEKWVFAIIPLKESRRYYMIDFTKEAEKTIEKHEFQSFLQILHQTLFKKILSGNLLKLEYLKVQESNDFSLFAAFILYNLLMLNWKDIPKDIGFFSEGEMKGFSNKILWLIYKIIIKKNESKDEFNQNEHSSTLHFSKIINNNANNDVTISKINNNNNNNIENIKNDDDVPKYSFPRKMLISQLKRFKNEIIEEVTQHKKSKSNVDSFLSSQNSYIKNFKNHDLLNLTKNQTKFSEKSNTTRRTYLHEEKGCQEQEMLENYQRFHDLLWFYYYYDKEAYQSLIKEYNKRLQNHLLIGLGLPPLPIYETEEIKHESKNNSSFIPQYNLKPKIQENGKFNKRKSIMKLNSFLTSNNNLITMTEPSQPDREIFRRNSRNSIQYDDIPLKNSEKNNGSFKSDRNFLKNDIISNSRLHINSDQRLVKLLSKNNMGSNDFNNDMASHRKSKSYLEVSNILTRKPSQNIILMNNHLEDNNLIKLNENNNNASKNNISFRKNSREVISLNKEQKDEINNHTPRKMSIFASKLSKIETRRNEPKIIINGNAKRVAH